MDWFCTACRTVNFHEKTTCFSCDRQRSPDAPCAERNNDGTFSAAFDWKCPDCGLTNFAKRRTCFHCEKSQLGRKAKNLASLRDVPYEQLRTVVAT